MPAAEGIDGGIELAGHLAGILPRAAWPVEVIGALRHELVDMGLRIDAIHPLVVCARDQVPEVADDVVGEDHFAEVVVVEAPGIRRAAGHHLEAMRAWMHPPDRAVDRRAGRLGISRPPHAARGEDAVAAVEPAVGAPHQAVHHVVGHVLRIEAVEDRLGRAVGTVVAIAVGHEDEFRRRGEPDAAVAKRDAGEVAAAVEKELSRVEPAVAVGVFKDEHAIGAGRSPFGIGVVFDDPQPAAGVGGDRDRLRDVGLGGEECDAKSLGHRDAADELGSGGGLIAGRLRVDGMRRRVGGPGGHDRGEQSDGREQRAVHAE